VVGADVNNSMGADAPLAEESGTGSLYSGVSSTPSSGPRLGDGESSQPGGPRIYDGHPPFNPRAYHQRTRAGAAAMGYGILGLSIGFFLAFIVAPRVAEWLA
jgi:hypothetical protein